MDCPIGLQVLTAIDANDTRLNEDAQLGKRLEQWPKSSGAFILLHRMRQCQNNLVLQKFRRLQASEVYWIWYAS